MYLRPSSPPSQVEGSPYKISVKNNQIHSMTDDKSTQIDRALGALGTLERATEFQTFLLLSSLAISLNISLTLTHQTNLVGFSWQYVRDYLPIGQALIFLTGFALYMSCIVGVLRYIVDELVRWPVESLASFIRTDTTGAKTYWGVRPTNMVRPYDLLNAARYEESGEYLEKYMEYIKKREMQNAASWRTSSLSFGLLVLIIADATLPAKASLTGNFVRFLDSACNGLGIFIAVFVILVLLVTWLFRFIENNNEYEWIIFPKLYEKLEKEFRENKQKQ